MLIVEKLFNAKKHYPIPPSNSTVRLEFHTWCIFPGVLDYINVFKNSWHVFCFCKVVLRAEPCSGLFGFDRKYLPQAVGNRLLNS